MASDASSSDTDNEYANGLAVCATIAFAVNPLFATINHCANLRRFGKAGNESRWLTL